MARSVAKQFLNADVMLASIMVVGSLVRATIYRWRMARMAKGWHQQELSARNNRARPPNQMLINFA